MNSGSFGTDRRSAHRIARSVWSARSLLPLSNVARRSSAQTCRKSNAVRQRQQAARTPNASRNVVMRLFLDLGGAKLRQRERHQRVTLNFFAHFGMAAGGDEDELFASGAGYISHRRGGAAGRKLCLP